MKRILFVDDEPGILDGLRRMLRSHRALWDMSFVCSGAEALAAMEAEPFDVLVTDMRMPGMSGAQLLEQVQQRHPGTVRIVLSGQADMESAMRSVSVSHQFLAKPCGAETLENVVDRACGLAQLLQDPKLQAILGGMSELPVLPRVYRALTSALAEPEVDVRRIGRIVEQDAGIASKVLQLVNSSFFGIRKEITDLQQATAYLGVNTIRDLVLTFEVFRQFETAGGVPGFSIEREQSHSLLTARIARRLASDKKSAEQAFLAGMLHDVGKLVMATRLDESLRKVLAAGAGLRRPFHAVEEQLLGVSHAELGAYLLGLWGMPYPVIEAVAHHHHPARVQEQTGFGVLAATHVADCLAREQEGCGAETIELDEHYLSALGAAARLPEWRTIAAEEAGCEPEAA
jgi:putative nucleotidyltransferase with HDIG domain